MKDLQNSKNCNIRSNLYVSEKKSARNFIFISIKQQTEKRPYSKLCETILFVFRIPPAHQCTIYSRLPHHFCSPEDNNISILKGHMYWPTWDFVAPSITAVVDVAVEPKKWTPPPPLLLLPPTTTAAVRGLALVRSRTPSSSFLFFDESVTTTTRFLGVVLSPSAGGEEDFCEQDRPIFLYYFY